MDDSETMSTLGAYKCFNVLSMRIVKTKQVVMNARSAHWALETRSRNF